MRLAEQRDALRAQQAALSARGVAQIDGEALQALDTASALQLGLALEQAGAHLRTVELGRFDSRHERVLRQVASSQALASGAIAQPAAAQALPEADVPVAQRGSSRPLTDSPAVRVLSRIGEGVRAAGELLAGHLSWVGLVMAELAALLTGRAQLRAKELATQMSRVCLEAIPVMALVTCLIGLVFAYLLGLQAAQYGANIYVVDGVALGMTREFSPLIVAVVAAGRSGSAIAAQLGTMRLNEETDAIAVLGMPVNQVLVVPRVLALVLAMPALVFVGDVAGISGAAIIAHLMLDITPTTYFARLQDALSMRHVLIGLVKGPVFGFAIAVIACAMSVRGPRDTRTIGANTTSTVVQGIVWVIVLDAVFAIVLQWMDW